MFPIRRSGNWSRMLFVYYIIISLGVGRSMVSEEIWYSVPCNDEEFQPPNCDFEKIPLLTVEDFGRCAPAMLEPEKRNYILGQSGRGITNKANKESYKKIGIVPKLLQDVSDISLGTTALGQKVSIPVGIAPTAFQKLAHPDGELGTLRGISEISTIQILSPYASTTIEDMAYSKQGPSRLWMEVFIFKNRSFTKNLVSRAEAAKFEAIVVGIDYILPSKLSCDSRIPREIPNLPGQVGGESVLDKSSTFKDVTWLKTLTKLPIVVKGILSAHDAKLAVSAGASGIIVSNHGGRMLDGAPATIDVLPGIVDAVSGSRPCIDVFVDGGIRNGWDIYKALASGAKMVFLGRPILYGLAIGGENGVKKIFEILTREFREAMLLSGASNPSKISRDTLIYPPTTMLSQDNF